MVIAALAVGLKHPGKELKYVSFLNEIKLRY